MIQNIEVELIARAFIRRGSDIVLCRRKGHGYFFLPGGHLEKGEFAKAALLRELKEELGEMEIRSCAPIGICENIFTQENIPRHEANFVFEVVLPESAKIESQEDHIELIPVSSAYFAEQNIRPEVLKTALAEYLESGKPFFIESGT